MPRKQRSSSPSPASDGFLEKVAAMIDDHRLLRRGDAVLAAVSGGPDSVALVVALEALARARRWRLGVGHVNHHLRGAESDGDQAFVGRLARKLGLELHAIDGEVEEGSNLEERAREVRYQRLQDLARAGGFKRIATGHTRDDQAETVLLRLLRGSGTSGLAGIAPRRDDGIIRPLLAVSREEVTGFLARRRLRFRNDRSNRSRRFTRNRVRSRLLPLLAREFNPAVGEALARAAELLRDDEDWLTEIARRLLGRLAAAGTLDAAGLTRLGAAAGRRVVRLWLEAERGDLSGIELEHIERVRIMARRGRGRISVPRGEVRLQAGRLHWRAARGQARDRMLAFPDFDVVLLEGGVTAAGGWRFRVQRLPLRRSQAPGLWRAVFDAEKLGRTPLVARTVRPGDRVRPLGLGGSKKLQDVFVDAKIPREERSGWPLVRAGETVLWVPGLVRGEHAPVSNRTRRVLVIEAKRGQTTFP